MLRGNVMIRPELRTAGGEVCDILYDGKYVGHITLVYREKEILSGSVQLDKRQMNDDNQEVVMDMVNEYVQSLIHALGVPECDVRVTNSKLTYVIATDQNVGTIERFVDHAVNDGYAVDSDDADFLQAETYELVIVEEDDDLLQYHIYKQSDESLTAEAFIAFHGSAVTGDMLWKRMPNEDELDAVTELLISDFDEEQIDEITIDMKHNGEVFERIELVLSDDLADEDDERYDDDHAVYGQNDYTAVLVRDEGDVLIYDVYDLEKDDSSIAQATIDISRLKITGILEFEQETNESMREAIAESVMDELEKEINFDSFHVTMMHNRVPIDNILFENEAIQG